MTIHLTTAQARAAGLTGIAFTALGVPKPAGSKRAFMPKGARFPVVTDACKYTKAWQYVVASAAQEAFCGDLLDGALELTVRFYFARPKSHFNKYNLKPSAPAEHCQAPDATKLVRAIEDALNKTVWRDDSQVVRQTVEKHWGEPARAEIEIRLFPAAPVTPETC